jgi:hypothetical protein
VVLVISQELAEEMTGLSQHGTLAFSFFLELQPLRNHDFTTRITVKRLRTR